MMLGFPKASITDIKGLDSPVAAKGHINATPTSMEVALVDYHGGMFWSHCAEWSLCGRRMETCFSDTHWHCSCKQQ